MGEQARRGKGAAIRWIVRIVVGVPFLVFAFCFASYMFQRQGIRQRHNDGIVLYNDQKFAEAIEVLEAVRKDHADLNAGWSARIAGIFVSTEEQGLDGNLAKACFQQADLLRARGKFEEALALYKKTESIDPDHPRLYEGLAENCYDRKDWKNGLAYARKGLEKDPSSIRLKQLVNQFTLKLRPDTATPKGAR